MARVSAAAASVTSPSVGSVMFCWFMFSFSRKHSHCVCLYCGRRRVNCYGPTTYCNTARATHMSVTYHGGRRLRYRALTLPYAMRGRSRAWSVAWRMKVWEAVPAFVPVFEDGNAGNADSSGAVARCGMVLAAEAVEPN